jgi:magnesium chelatase family protein
MKSLVDKAIAFRQALGGEPVFSGEAESFLDNAHTKYALSMRSRGKVIGVARTIACIEGSRIVREVHLAEALSYRKEE